MKLRAPDQDARLTSEEIEMIHSVLTACSQVLYWAERHGGPQFHAALAAAESPRRRAPAL